MTWPDIDLAALVARLTPPAGPQAMVLDTDTYNEIDDQFAVVYALASPTLTVEALYAAPFLNHRSTSAGDGMEKSYEEILRLLERTGHRPEGLVHRGSPTFLPAADTPVESPAALDLIDRALTERDGPLQVVAIGCPTNVASALLLEPRIRERIVVVWLGGQPHFWPSAREFNLQQDPHASRVLLDSGVPLVHIPCALVAEMLRTTWPELQRYLTGRGAIGEYLLEIYREYVGDGPARSKVIWDISAIAWLIDPRWLPSYLEASPILTAGLTYSRDAGRHPLRVVRNIDRDAVFADLFAKLETLASG